MVSERMSLLQQINPNAHPEDANCPETADAVNDFFNSGQVRPVRTASATARFVFPPGLRWTPATLNNLGGGLSNCSHVVVRGRRNPAVQGVTPEHYFVVFKVDNVIWVADAYSLELIRGVQVYVNTEPVPQRMITFHVASGGAYDIIVDDPLSGM
jgi:hypothetical protein